MHGSSRLPSCLTRLDGVITVGGLQQHLQRLPQACHPRLQDLGQWICLTHDAQNMMQAQLTKLSQSSHDCSDCKQPSTVAALPAQQLRPTSSTPPNSPAGTSSTAPQASRRWRSRRGALISWSARPSKATPSSANCMFCRGWMQA